MLVLVMLAAAMAAPDAFARKGRRGRSGNWNRNRNRHVTFNFKAKPPRPDQDLSARARMRLSKLVQPVDRDWEIRQQSENKLELLDRALRAEREEELFIALTRKNVIASGRNINEVDEAGRTLLHDAAALGYAEAVALLLDHGADPRLRDRSGLTAGDLAKAVGDEQIMRLLSRPLPAR